MHRIAVVGCRPPKQPSTPQQKDIYRAILTDVWRFFREEVTLMMHAEEIVIVSGGALGVDSVAEHIADVLSLKMRIYKPDYPKGHGYPCGCSECRRAPLIRNKQIVEDCDELHAWIAPWSRGTVVTVGLARVLKKPVIDHDFRDDVGWPHRREA